MNESSIEQAAALYQDIGLTTVPQQAALVMGDCKCIASAAHFLLSF
jgi:hypothetical protein